ASCRRAPDPAQKLTPESALQPEQAVSIRRRIPFAEQLSPVAQLLGDVPDRPEELLLDVLQALPVLHRFAPSGHALHRDVHQLASETILDVALRTVPVLDHRCLAAAAFGRLQ